MIGGGDLASARAHLGRRAFRMDLRSSSARRCSQSGDPVGAVRRRLMTAPEPFLPLNVLANPIVRCATLAGACCMATLVGLTIFVPLYFEMVLHLSASQSGLALIPLMGATVVTSTLTGRLMVDVRSLQAHVAVGGSRSAICRPRRRRDLADRRADLLVVAAVCGSGARASARCFRSSTVCMQNAVSRAQMGIATGVANFFRSLVLGAGGRAARRDRARRARRRRRRIGRNAGAHGVATDDRVRLPLRVPGRRAGALLSGSPS